MYHKQMQSCICTVIKIGCETNRIANEHVAVLTKSFVEHTKKQASDQRVVLAYALTPCMYCYLCLTYSWQTQQASALSVIRY